jgi:hypothetical protein
LDETSLNTKTQTSAPKGFPRPEKLIETAIASCPEPDQLRFALHTFPALRETSLNLARLIGNIVLTRDGSEPLLHACLRAAWCAYLDSVKDHAAMRDRAAAFMRGLFQHADQVNEWRVYVAVGNSNIPWLVGVESLQEFMARYPNHTPRIVRELYAPVDGRSARQSVAARTIDLYYVSAFGGSLDQIIQAPAAP